MDLDLKIDISHLVKANLRPQANYMELFKDFIEHSFGAVTL